MFYFPASLDECTGLEKDQRVRDHNIQVLRENRKPPGILTVVTVKATNL